MLAKRRVFLVLVVAAVAAAFATGAFLTLLVLRGPGASAPHFTPREWTLDLMPGLSYGPPVVGPTTPLSSDRGGGLWVINYASEGSIRMDLTRFSLEYDSSPFAVGNDSLMVDVTRDFQTTPGPPITGPLRSVFYIVPGRNTTNDPGPLGRNGALAFFAGRDFLVASPFDRTVRFRYTLGFDPVWMGEDPTSAGEMLVLPQERSEFPFPGLPGPEVGPYRYFWASDGSRTVVFEVTYVHELDPTPLPVPRVIFFNGTLSASPFVYFNQDYVLAQEHYRSGLGQGILLPRANGTLEIANVTGMTRAWIPLTLDGEPAVVAGSIGFTRTSYPMRLYVPLRSSSATGIAFLDFASLTFVFQYSVPGSGLEVLGRPTSYRGASLFLGLLDSATDKTRFIGLNETGAIVPWFGASLTGRVQNYFDLPEFTKVFAYTAAGTILTLSAISTASDPGPPATFPIRPPSSASVVVYAGSPGGTRYGPALIPFELMGVWTDAASGRTAMFELLGLPSSSPIPSRYLATASGGQSLDAAVGPRRDPAARSIG